MREATGATFMLRCAELGLSREDLDDMTVGMVYDMLIEQTNDQEKYPYKATQADINRFFRKGEVDGGSNQRHNNRNRRRYDRTV